MCLQGCLKEVDERPGNVSGQTHPLVPLTRNPLRNCVISCLTKREDLGTSEPDSLFGNEYGALANSNETFVFSGYMKAK